jgi:hypothetical protein
LHYLDDLLFLHSDPAYLEKATAEIVRFLNSLGWVITIKKSEARPKQKFTYLGWEWNSRISSVYLPHDGVQSKLHILHQLKNDTQTTTKTTARKIAKTTGSLCSTRLQHCQASLFLRLLDSVKNAALRVAGWEGRVSLLSNGLLDEISWWENALRTNNPRTITRSTPQAILCTNDSPIGWGAHI